MRSGAEEIPLYSRKAQGKFLLTAEYAVLDGALALALPLRLGQEMKIHQTHTPGLLWHAFLKDGSLWQFHQWNPQGRLIDSSHPEAARWLVSVFCVLENLGVQPLYHQSIRVETTLDFDPSWGLGSSSTFLSLLSDYTKQNPYLLNEKVLKGSGYDIACAFAKLPLLFQRREHHQPYIQSIDFTLPQPTSWWWLYTGRKQNSLQSVEAYRSIQKNNHQWISTVSGLTQAVVDAKSWDEMIQLLQEHEVLMGKHLNKVPIQSEYFNDFEGIVKSLGAWGGDFVLVGSLWDDHEVRSYFESRGLKIIIPYKDLIFAADE